MPFENLQWRDGDRSLPASAARMRKLGAQYQAVTDDIGTPGTPVGDAFAAAAPPALTSDDAAVLFVLREYT